MSDDDVLKGALLVVGRVGPQGLTLAAVAEEVGLRAPTLIQRFGSKRGLLLAVAARGVHEVAPLFNAARRSHSSPSGAMVAALLEMVRGIDSPAAMGHHLAFLAMDLADPDLRGLAAAHAAALMRELEAGVTEAIAAGELIGVDSVRGAVPAGPAALARVIYTAYNGSLIGWAVDGRGRLGTWITLDIVAALAPYLKGTSAHA